ncbi:MAG: cyclase [Pelodictyon luteolum]|uniref:Cyclase n=1 Tax=Pelodictyon luteolum TaxID=1100 RepID=A0A165MDI3_PELLU|nr:SRPBCC family protein [Pelodictyon luteolum]KZK75115.1 MAG: cyclase [Pelodictyon luteolum]
MKNTLQPITTLNPINSHSLKLRGEDATVELRFLEHDILGVSGSILVNTPPAALWQALTEYDNLHNTLPKVVLSRLVSREQGSVVLEQTGKTGIFFFEITVRFRLKVKEEPFDSIAFEQVDGDFSIYRGHWKLEPAEGCLCTLLTYSAEIRPDFFAPSFLVAFVQRQDLPEILKAHKKRAESLWREQEREEERKQQQNLLS